MFISSFATSPLGNMVPYEWIDCGWAYGLGGICGIGHAYLSPTGVWTKNGLSDGLWYFFPLTFLLLLL